MASKTLTISMKGHFIPCESKEHSIETAVIIEHISNQSIHVTPEMRNWILHVFTHGLSECVDLERVPNFTETINKYVLTTYLQANYYDKPQIDQMIVGAFKFQGECTYEELWTKPLVQGHVWQVTTNPEGFQEDAEYACNGVTWIKLGFNIDLSAYIKKTEAEEKIATAKAEAISTAATDASTKANTVQVNLDTHVADNVKHITSEERESWNSQIATLKSKFSYVFINEDASITLEDKLYIVRDVKLAAVLPACESVPDNIAIRLIVNEEAATKGGKIVAASGDSIEGQTMVDIDAAMDVMIICDKTTKNWIMVGHKM